jgi:hypothetical protein
MAAKKLSKKNTGKKTGKRKGGRAGFAGPKKPSYKALRDEIKRVQAALQAIAFLGEDDKAKLKPRQLAQAEAAVKALGATLELTDCGQTLGPYED